MGNEILLKYIEGVATEDEIAQVVNWLESDEKNMQEYLLLRKAFDASLWNDSRPDQNEKKVQKSKYFKFFREAIKIAAMFAIILGSYHLIFTKWFVAEEIVINQTVFTPEGQRAELTLADGTKVWLNAKSTLIFPNQFSGKERNVKLTGEAYFDVTHDKEKQFVVETQDYKVRVLGTEFNVRSYPDIKLFETSLINGSVEILSADNISRETLIPGDIIFSEKGLLVKSSIEDYDKLAWKEGILSFKDASLKEILDKLSLYYDVKFTVKNELVLEDKYTGKFWIKDGSDQVLRVLQGVYNAFSYTKDEMNHITIH